MSHFSLCPEGSAVTIITILITITLRSTAPAPAERPLRRGDSGRRGSWRRESRDSGRLRRWGTERWDDHEVMRSWGWSWSRLKGMVMRQLWSQGGKVMMVTRWKGGYGHKGNEELMILWWLAAAWRRGWWLQLPHSQDQVHHGDCPGEILLRLRNYDKWIFWQIQFCNGSMCLQVCLDYL